MKSAPRVRRSATEWQQLVDEQITSGLSVAAFCRQHGIVYQSFMNWRRRAREQLLDMDSSNTRDAQPLPPFIELSSPASSPERPASAWLVELDIGDGLQLRIGRRD